MTPCAPRLPPISRRAIRVAAFLAVVFLELACGNGGDATGGECAAGQTSCNGECVDVALDALNCGACGAACGAGQSCSAGACVCASGSLDCGAGCTSVAADTANCGGCGIHCQVGQTCSAGSCVCQLGLVPCSGACVNTQSDGANCGTCAVACTGSSVCANGACSASCPPGTQPCGASCATLASDPVNCGGCGVTCVAGQSCVNGSCSCPAGQAFCAGACVDTSASATNCGACGVSCGAGRTCSASSCTGSGGTGGALTGGSGGATSDAGGTMTGGAGGASGTGGTTPGGSGGALGGSGGASGGSGGAMGGSGGVTGGSGGAETGGGATGGAGGSTTGGSAGSDYLCDVGVWTGTPPQPLTLSGNTFAHDPTMIEADGTYYRFWTGNYIPSATSTNLTNWSNAPTVYPNSYPSWVSEWRSDNPGNTFNFPWAPDVSFYNGQYHIYSSFSAFFGDNISCITHLTTSSIAAGGWVDHEPVVCTTGSENHNAIDADAGLDFDGNPYLAFGSFWDGIMLIPLNADGSRSGSEMTRIAWAREIEAPVLFRRCGYYYLFVTWGLCCPGEGRSIDQLTYRVAVGRSTSIVGPYVDRNGTSMIDGGGTLLVQGDDVAWAAAGHSDVLVTGDKIYHLYHAYRQSNGEAQLRIVELPFDDEGWPVPGGP